MITLHGCVKNNYVQFLVVCCFVYSWHARTLTGTRTHARAHTHTHTHVCVISHGIAILELYGKQGRFPDGYHSRNA
jgi:hypothetical protein